MLDQYSKFQAETQSSAVANQFFVSLEIWKSDACDTSAEGGNLRISVYVLRQSRENIKVHRIYFYRGNEGPNHHRKKVKLIKHSGCNKSVQELAKY